MQAINSDLALMLDGAFDLLRQGRQAYSARLIAQELGVVTSVSMGTATVSGLPSARFEELLEFPGGMLGLVFNMDPEELGVVLLGDSSQLTAGMEVQRTGRVMDIPVGGGLLGRVIDATARPLDGKGPLGCQERWPVERLPRPS